MSYNLFIDDLRDPDHADCVRNGIDLTLDWVVVRSTLAARKVVLERGMPLRLALDHDLGLRDGGIVDEVSEFLTWLILDYSFHYSDGFNIPSYTIHTSNPEGRKNLVSKMVSWKKMIELD